MTVFRGLVAALSALTLSIALPSPGDRQLKFVTQAEADDLVASILEANRRTQWLTLSPGFAMRRMAIGRAGLTVHAWAVDPKQHRIAVVEQLKPSGSSTAEFRAAHNALLAINGGFFEKSADGTLSPSGLLIVDGDTRHPYHEKAGSGVLHAAGDKVGLDWSRLAGAGQQWTHALQVGPMVVDPGGRNGIRSNDNTRVDRSAVCLADGKVVFIVVDGGLSLFELGRILSESELAGGFGCERALNLDGGPSTQVSFAHGGQTVEVTGDWPVQNGIVVMSRK
ncbi:MAG: phosphodiester glycosidase family protein [Hyphomicrobiales bacterium]